MPILNLNWGSLAAFGTVLEGTNTIDTGGVNVSVGVEGATEGDIGVTINLPSYVADGEPFPTDSHLKLFGDGINPDGSSGPGDVSTTTISFDSADPLYGDEVQNVSFRINDIDGAAVNDTDGGPAPAFEDIVSIRAYDADGNLVPVTLTPGGDVTVVGNTATGDGDGNQLDPNNSMLISIAGPVSRIEIDYDNGEGGEQNVLVSDVYFETTDSDNEDPDAVDDSTTTDVGTPVTIPVLTNDSDPDGDPLDIIDVTDPPNGSVTENPDGTITYTPDPGFTGEDTFSYTITDGNGGEDTAIVTVTVDDPNGPPDAVNDSTTTTVGDPVTIPVLGNDSDPDGDPLDITDVSDPPNGSVTENPDGTITYTPDPGFTGEDTFSYTITDGNGGEDTAIVTVTVDDPNGPPVATDDSETTLPDEAVIISVLDNDSDPDGDPLDIIDVTDPPNGSVTENPDGTITYTPDPGFVGEDTFSYTITDGNGESDTAIVTVSVTEGRIDTDIFPVDPSLQPIDPFDGIDEDPDPLDDLDSVTGTTGDDVIRTGDDADTIIALGGDDTILPGIDDDLVEGRGGDDFINDIQGADTIGGGSGDDTIIAGINTFSDYAGDDTFFDDGNLGATLGFDADPNQDDGRDSVTGGVGNDSILTGDDRDTIDAGADDDFVDAGIDDDSVFGANGDDTLIGSHGSDTIDGGQGDDFIDASNFASLEIPDDVDLVPENDRDSVEGGAGNDTIFTGDDNDYAQGDQGDDFIDLGIDDDTGIGGSGSDTILGGAGEDILNGGEGTDSLVGGADRDTIIVSSVAEGIDDTVDGSAEGDDFDRLDLTGVGVRGEDWRLVNTTTDSNGNGLDGTVEFLDDDGDVIGSFDFTEIEEIVPCFTPGTTIATPTGQRLVEDLQVGDRVITRDNGLQEIRWLGRKELTGHQLARLPHLKPILIQAGSLGDNLPEHDMLVSPNHRILVNNDKTSLYFEEREVLAAAKHLTGLDGVDEVGTLGVTYVHFMFDQHEVVLSNGAWTESFQPGDYTMSGMGNAQRNEIFELFPDLKTPEGLEGYTAARRSLKRHEAQLLSR